MKFYINIIILEKLNQNILEDKMGLKETEEKLNKIIYNKLVFVLGWLSVLNLLFWVIVSMVYFLGKNKDKFWNEETFKVVYIFGWINLIAIIGGIILMFYI